MSNLFSCRVRGYNGADERTRRINGRNGSGIIDEGVSESGVRSRFVGQDSVTRAKAGLF